jgi:hypothetical protein
MAGLTGDLALQCRCAASHAILPRPEPADCPADRILARVRKADILGRSGSYIPQGARRLPGGVLSVEERRYKPGFFRLYEAAPRATASARQAEGGCGPGCAGDGICDSAGQAPVGMGCGTLIISRRNEAIKPYSPNVAAK